MMPSPLLMALAEMGAQPGGGAPWWATRGGPLEPLNEGMAGPPAPSPGPRPAPYSGPGGFHPINDIMTLHGTYRQPVSAYGEGMPSNYDIYRQRLEQAPVQADTLRSQAAMAQAQAMQAQADVERQKLDPLNLWNVALANLVGSPAAPPEVRDQASEELSGRPNPAKALAAVTGPKVGVQPGGKSAPMTDVDIRRLAENAPPGGFAPGSPEATGASADPHFASRYAGQPAGLLEREIVPGDKAGSGAFSVGHLFSGLTGDINRPDWSFGPLAWLLRFSGNISQPPTARELAERNIGAAFPRGMGKLRPGARIEAQLSSPSAQPQMVQAPVQSVDERQKARAERQARNGLEMR